MVWEISTRSIDIQMLFCYVMKSREFIDFRYQYAKIE